MLRIRAIVSIVVMLGLVAGTGGGLRGSATLAATTLAPARSFPAPDNVQGLAHGGGSLWATTPSAYDASIPGGYRGIIFEMDPATGAVRKSFSIPALAVGLTHDGTYLYAPLTEGRAWCDGGVSRTTPGAIAAIDPATGQVVRTIPNPITGGQGGLAAVSGKLFAVGAVMLDACANNQQGISLGVVIAEIDPADGTLLRYRNVDALGISPRELDANGTNLLYGTNTSGGFTVHTLAPTLTGKVLQTTVLAVPSGYHGPDTNGLAGGANELFVANRGDGRIYVFPNMTPAITGLSPASVQVNSPGFTLTIDGKDFESGATVRWNGTSLSTTLVSSTQLTATVPQESITAVGTAEIEVFNGKSALLSTPRAFFITETDAAIVGTSSGTSTSDNGTTTVSDGDATTTATATGSGTITLGEYTGNPVSTPPPDATEKYFDVHVASGSVFTTITLQNCDLGGGNIIYWYNSGATPPAWEAVSDQSYDPATQCITLTLTTTTAPSVTQLTRTEFGVGTVASFLAPLKAGTVNSFKVGSTIPVKLARVAPGRTVTLEVLPGNQTGVHQAGTTSVATTSQAADSTNQFRYDSACACYIYNLGTKTGFTAGDSYTLVAWVDNQRAAAIVITAKK